MLLKKMSALSGKMNERELPIEEADYLAWKYNRRLLVQDAFPHLSADDREFLLTGATPEEWKEAFGEEEEDTGDDSKERDDDTD